MVHAGAEISGEWWHQLVSKSWQKFVVGHCSGLCVFKEYHLGLSNSGMKSEKAVVIMLMKMIVAARWRS